MHQMCGGLACFQNQPGSSSLTTGLAPFQALPTGSKCLFREPGSEKAIYFILLTASNQQFLIKLIESWG